VAPIERSIMPLPQKANRKTFFSTKVIVKKALHGYLIDIIVLEFIEYFSV